MIEYELIKKLPKDQQPYERFYDLGVTSLTNAELLAIIIRSGTHDESAVSLASKILEGVYTNGILNLHQLNSTQLQKIKGIGKVKSMQIQCIAELSRRLAKATAKQTLCFQHPESIANYYMEDMRHLHYEQIIVSFLDTKNHFIGDTVISSGTVNCSVITPREVFIEAIKAEAVNLVMIHNHPSGDPSPSKEDIVMTKRLQLSGEMLGIHFIDHIIIGDNAYVSMKEKKLID